MPRETVEVEGHIIDSLILAKVLDVILDAGADYRMVEVEIGRTNVDASRARLEVDAPDDDTLARLLVELQVHGANRVAQSDATVVVADQAGVLPAGFYSTTNLPTAVRLSGRWVEVENPEMDCALVALPDGRVRTVPMHRVAVGDQVVVGDEGVRVTAPEKPRGSSPFEFMTSDVSSEKPKDVLVARVAERVRVARAAGGKVLAVCGPACGSPPSSGPEAPTRSSSWPRRCRRRSPRSSWSGGWPTASRRPRPRAARSSPCAGRR